jgi:hypothetical protein
MMHSSARQLPLQYLGQTPMERYGVGRISMPSTIEEQLVYGAQTYS